MTNDPPKKKHLPSIHLSNLGGAPRELEKIKKIGVFVGKMCEVHLDTNGPHQKQQQNKN